MAANATDRLSEMSDIIDVPEAWETGASRQKFEAFI
jgi:hypothetical protein